MLLSVERTVIAFDDELWRATHFKHVADRNAVASGTSDGERTAAVDEEVAARDMDAVFATQDGALAFKGDRSTLRKANASFVGIRLDGGIAECQAVHAGIGHCAAFDARQVQRPLPRDALSADGGVVVGREVAGVQVVVVYGLPEAGIGAVVLRSVAAHQFRAAREHTTIRLDFLVVAPVGSVFRVDGGEVAAINEELAHFHGITQIP